jgi:DNA-binding CsgD family transcriptional regulator
LADVRAVFRLISECREVGADPQLWRRHMLDGLRRLTGAQVAMYLQIRHLGTDHEQIAEPLDSGFLDDSDRALWAHYQRENAHRDDPFHLRYFGTFTGALRTRSLESVVNMPDWQRSRHYNEYLRVCRLDDRITSSVQLPESSPAATQVIVLHRSIEDGRYPRRARRLVHLFHQELIPLLGRQLALPGAPAASPALPIQLQQVLRYLLCGDSEKQVAARLGLSPHTVNRHVQRLYRRFDVHSRGELMFRCRDMLAGLVARGRRSGDQKV